jgi:hypothetical protein
MFLIAYFMSPVAEALNNEPSFSDDILLLNFSMLSSGLRYQYEYTINGLQVRLYYACNAIILVSLRQSRMLGTSISLCTMITNLLTTTNQADRPNSTACKGNITSLNLSYITHYPG